MIALAKATYADYPRLSFQCMDALNLNVDQTFNLIFSNATLHWITDHKTLIKQCYKALSVNGKLYLKMGGKGDVAGIIDAMDVVKSSSRWQSYLSEFRFPYIFLDIEDYEVILNDAGFRIDKLDIVSKDALHQGQSGLTCWLRTTWLPYMSRIPINGQTAFIDEVTAYYLT